MRRVVYAAILAVSLAGCARWRHAGVADALPPHIDAVRPDSVLLPRGGVVEVTIVGRNFAPATAGGANTIQFAGMSLANIRANAAGTEIRFAIPDMVSTGGEAPPALLESGVYPVRITTAVGASNAVAIRVFR